MSFRPERASTRAVEKSRRSYQPVTEADNPISPRDPAGRLEMTALLPCLDVICTRTHVDNTATNVDKCGYVWTSRWIQRDISGKRVCKKRTGCGREVDCHRWFSTVHTEGGELWMGCPPLVRVQLGPPSGRIRSCPHYPQPLLRLLFFSIYSKEIRGTGHTGPGARNDVVNGSCQNRRSRLSAKVHHPRWNVEESLSSRPAASRPVWRHREVVGNDAISPLRAHQRTPVEMTTVA